eukprot:Lithocolla_globosa_v1_NODE_4689_length_1386_cov_7.768595.p1 type:complete len:399 gc:universal NODE_4689_length_1386_cov_7.768595:1202-6(-)
MSLTEIPPALMKQIKHFASFRPRSVALNQVVSFGSDPSQATLLRVAEFLRGELPVRLAHRVLDLETLQPKSLATSPSFTSVKLWYATSFKDLIEHPKFVLASHKLKLPPPTNSSLYYGSSIWKEEDLPDNVEDLNKNFAQCIEKIKRRHDNVVEMISEGIMEFKGQNDAATSSVITPEIQAFLDRFFLSRIGIRFLIGQQVALVKRNRDNDYVGIVCTKTNIREIIQEASDNARFLCQDNYDLYSAPVVRVFCPEDLTFPYVPSHLHHILFELLKNSLRAVVEHCGADADEFPEIQVVVADGANDLTIKISDQGGGIPRKQVENVWTYFYTTAAPPSRHVVFSEQTRPPMAGLGYGLPLSRLYARYFGGDLKIISMDGFGTDAYVQLCRLGDGEEPLA